MSAQQEAIPRRFRDVIAAYAGPRCQASVPAGTRQVLGIARKLHSRSLTIHRSLMGRDVI